MLKVTSTCSTRRSSMSEKSNSATKADLPPSSGIAAGALSDLTAVRRVPRLVQLAAWATAAETLTRPAPKEWLKVKSPPLIQKGSLPSRPSRLAVRIRISLTSR